MLIGIDGNEANIKNRVGVGRYAFEILKKFKEFSIPNLQFSIYLKNKPLDDMPEESEFWKYKVIGPRRMWTQIGLPFNLYFSNPRPDVFFTPTHYAPRFCPCPSVVSVMDLSFLRFPEMFKKSDLYQLINWTAYSVKNASKIMTISKSSKDDIINYYHVPEEKVVVTYPGLSEVLGNKYYVLSMEEIRKKYGIIGDYVLSVGTLQPRKNYIKLIEALSNLEYQSSKLQLVIVGKKGWMYEEILEAPKKFGIEDKVKFLDYVEDQDLPTLYKNAKCFILVSLYEGFGLPVLEAMSYGCPVITSNVSSLPEVAGDAGILVDPQNAQEIANKLHMVLNMPPEERQQMIQKGLEQTKKFSWEKCAQETLKTLKEIGEKHV